MKTAAEWPPLNCPSWDRTRTLLIQSRADRVCLEDTMSVSGCPPSIGARKAWRQLPLMPAETLVERLQEFCLDVLPNGVCFAPLLAQELRKRF
jgi:hypothetical protein